MKALTGPALGLAAVLLAWPAMAQNPTGAGTTSGPAAGGNATPSAAAQKDNPASQTGAGQQGSAGSTSAGAMGAGAPGMAAKPGSEAGPAAKPASK
jgi:hypothetical protein